MKKSNYYITTLKQIIIKDILLKLQTGPDDHVL